MRGRIGAVLLASAMLSACGGGGGGTNSTPAPSPSPSPSPTPTPSPDTNFDTAEYRRSDGAFFHDAAAGWQLAATGQGVTIGIVDTGIDTDSPEFAGRISSASADVAGTRSIEDPDGHGTMVALLAAAARDDTGIVGIAWESSVMALRADSPGSCATADPNDPDSGCTFFDSDIAAGVDRAVANGAKVINLSLGGSAPTQQLRNAVSDAAAAGVVVVVSAGNDANDPAPSTDPNEPDPFATGLRQAGNGNVIIAGSVDSSGVLSDFSNRAGSEADSYLAALGEEVCCVYEDGVLKTSVQNGQTFVTVVSGTSFSAPQIAGAAALLFQAFPNLSATEVVELLLNSARDAGATGTDTTYGRGILDIAAAFEPQGTTSLAGSSTTVPLNETTLITSSAMGDAMNSPASLEAVVLDSYRRAYSVDLAQNRRSARVSPRLASSLIAPLRQVRGGSEGLSLAFSVDGSRLPEAFAWSRQLRLVSDDARGAEVLAGRVVASLSPDMQLAFGYARGADGLISEVQGAKRPAFMVAGSPSDGLGFSRTGEFSIAVRQRLGLWGLTVNAERGSASTGVQEDDLTYQTGRFARSPYARIGLGLDRDWGNLDTALAASWLSEERTMLGASLHEAFGSAGSDSVFLDARAGWNFASHWRLGAAWRQGFTRARTHGLVAAGSRLVSNGWAFDLSLASLFHKNDTIALRVSQPLRVASGGINLNLPVAYSYETLEATQGIRRLSLAPRGREVTSEIAWRGPLWGGLASASLFYRKDPGHYANLPDERGIGLSWNSEF